MKKLIILLCLITSWWTQAQISIVEDFNNGIPFNWLTSSFNNPNINTISTCNGTNEATFGFEFNSSASFETANSSTTSNGAAITVSLRYRSKSFTSINFNHSITIQYARNNSNTWTTFYTSPTYTTAQSCATLNAEIISGQTAFGDNVKFKLIVNNGSASNNVFDVTVDNFSATQAINLPTNLQISNILARSAQLSWTASNPAPALGYDYYIDTIATIPATSAIATGSVSTGIVTKLLTNLTANTLYYAYVRSNFSSTVKSAWSPVRTLTTLALPANDECANAIPLTVGTTAVSNAIEGTTTNGTFSNTNSTCGGGNGNQDVWFSAVVPASGNLTIETSASNIIGDLDTLISAFNSTCGSLIQLACDDDGGIDSYSKIILTGQTPNSIVKIKVRMYNNGTLGNFRISAYDLTTPVVCSVPTNLTATNIAVNGATISWTAPSTAPANGYAFFLSLDNIAPLASFNSNDLVAAGQTSIILDEQSQNTIYYVWIRSLCSSINKSAWVGPISFTTLARPFTLIPNINFENKLIDLSLDSGATDGKVFTEDINTLTDLDVSNSNISNLTGIQDFVALTNLNCSNNLLTSLNIANNTSLNILNCTNNQLTALNVTNNNSLTQLFANQNDLTTLNVSNLLSLTKLGVSDSALTTLNVANNLNLIELACSNNLLTSLNISLNTALVALYCNGNLLTTLNVKNGNNTNFTVGSSFLNNPNLACITADSFALTSSTWTTYKDASAIYSLDCSVVVCNVPTAVTSSAIAQTTATISWTAASPAPANGYQYIIKTTNVAPSPSPSSGVVNVAAGIVSANLTGLVNNTIYYYWVRSNCSTTNKSAWTNSATFTTLASAYTLIPDINFENKLIALGIDSGATDGQVLTQNINTVTGLFIQNTNINDLTGIQDFIALKFLNCSNNNLINLSISNNTALVNLNCSQNNLTNLSISNNTALVNLNCGQNNLTNLSIANNTALDVLNCNQNNLTNLSLSNNTALRLLDCVSNNLTSLSVINNNALFELRADNNDITAINVSNLVQLITLRISGNQLTNINLTNNLLLENLYIDLNNLTSLNVSNNVALKNLDCSNNNFESLDLSQNVILTSLQCRINIALTSLNLQNGNNVNFNNLLINYNPLLACIKVDNLSYANNTNLWINAKDPSAIYSLDCTGVVCNVPTAVTSSAIAQTTATISWSAASPAPAVGYEYYRSASATAPTATKVVTGATAAGILTANLTALNANTQYYVWVRSVCSATTKSAWSSVGTFTTLAAPVVCNVPTGLLSVLVQQNTTTIGWTFVTPTPATGYDYFVSTSSTTPLSSSVVTGSTIGNAANLTGLLANTQYYFWIRSVCSATSKSAWSNSETFTTLPAPAVCNTTSNISISSITQTTALLSWSAAVPALPVGYGYDYYISTSATSPTATTSATASAVAITSLTLNNLVANTTYYLWMRTNCSATSTSAWSTVNSFTTLPTVSACQEVLAGSIAVNGITTTGGNIFWTAPSPAPANGYDVYVSTANVAPIATSAISYYTATGNIVSLLVNNLLNNTTYFVWVRSFCDGTSQSAWTGGYSFSTGTLASTTFDNSNFVYFPNPVTSNLTLKLNQNIDKVEISNLLGQILFDKKFDTNSSEIDFSSYPAGNYLVKVISNNESKIIRIIKN